MQGVSERWLQAPREAQVLSGAVKQWAVESTLRATLGRQAQASLPYAKAPGEDAPRGEPLHVLVPAVHQEHDGSFTFGRWLAFWTRLDAEVAAAKVASTQTCWAA